MTPYNYLRELVDGKWNINNQYRVDGNGDQIQIVEEIKTAIPGKFPNMVAKDENVTFEFAGDLSAGQHTTLTQVVNDHKNNV